MKSTKSKKGHLYIFQLEKKSRHIGTKFGISKDPRARSRQTKTPSFAYADRVREALAFVAVEGLAEEIEGSIKDNFKHHLVPTEWNTTEIVFPWISNALIWTIEACLENPDRVSEITWRGANKPFSLLSSLEVTLGDRGFGKRNFGSNFFRSDDINKYLRSIDRPALCGPVPSTRQRLRQGHHGHLWDGYHQSGIPIRVRDRSGSRRCRPLLLLAAAD